MVTWASSDAKTRTGGAPGSPFSSTFHPARLRTSCRAAASPVKLAIWPPVTKPTPDPGGRPRSSRIHDAAVSSMTETAGEVA